MKPITIAAVILITIVAVSTVAYGYTQNWFASPNPEPTPTATPTQQPTQNPTEQPTQTTNPTATTKPAATSQPTAKPTKQPTSVAAMDLTLEIYGNANMDDKVDSSDVSYLQQILSSQKTATLYSDANMDGTVDTDDFTQLNALLDRTAEKIYLQDGNKQNISVSLPANRLVVEYTLNTELIRILELEDLVVGIDSGVEPVKQLYFPDNYADITSVGNMYTPDYEAVLNVNPTTLLTFTSATADKAAHLPGVDVVFLGLYPNVTKPEDSRFFQGVLKAGYIFDRVDRATEYANWILGITSEINAKANTIPEADRKTVMITNSPTINTGKVYTPIDTLGQACTLVGGLNVVEDLSGYAIIVENEWILDQDPDYVFIHTVRYTYGGETYEPPQGIDATDPSGMADVLQQYKTQPGYDDLTAVKNNNVYMIAGDFRNNAMGGTLGAVYMAKVLYPDVYTDINPQEIHQEYITHFLRLDYSLDTNGVYLYPAINVNGDIVGIPN